MAVINVKSETDLSGFYIVFKGSVQLETKGTYGVSHLCEHMIFHNLDHLLDDFDKYGISNNAYTSDNEIVIYFTGLDEHLSLYKDKILQSVLSFNITEEMFENERLIVIKEYNNAFNSPKSSHKLNLFRKIYDIYRPIGLKEDLENLTFNQFKDFYYLLFSKPHDIINVSKYNEYDTNIEFSDKEINTNVIQHINDNFTMEKVIDYNSSNCSIINLSNIVTDDFPLVSFITSMLGDGLKSPLYQELREKKGLIYYVHCYLDQLNGNQGLVNISTETTLENLPLIQNSINEILSNPDKYMTQERFDIVKQSMEIAFKKMNINRYSNVDRYITDFKWQIEPILKDLTLEKVMPVYSKYFNFDSYHKSIDIYEFKNN